MSLYVVKVFHSYANGIFELHVAAVGAAATGSTAADAAGGVGAGLPAAVAADAWLSISGAEEAGAGRGALQDT